MDKIIDNASIVEIKTQIRDYKKILTNKKLLKEMKITPIKKMKMESDIKKLESKIEELVKIPDEFNQLFEGTGWIAYEGIKVEVLEDAIRIAKEKGIEIAEEILVDYYTNREEIKIRSYKVKNRLKSHGELFTYGLEDHFQGKYYSSIPIFLMIIDGFVHEIEQTGFFTESTNLIAWDSIVGHQSGLEAVSKLMSQTRRKTNIEEIRVPYRNGILHGRDINYANVYVSSKTLSVIFALIDWASAKEKMKAGSVKEFYTPPTIEESFSAIRKISETHEQNMSQYELISKWKKRNIKVGIDIRKSGSIEDYTNGTPERVLVEFFSILNSNNYGRLVEKIFYDNTKVTQGKKIQELKPKINNIFIESFELLGINEQGSALTIIKTALTLRIQAAIVTKEWSFRMAFADTENNYLARGSENGAWRVIDDFSEDFLSLKNSLC